MNCGNHCRNSIVSMHDQGAGGNELKKEMLNKVEMTIHNLVVGDPVHEGEGVVGVLQEDADPREGPLDGGDGSSMNCG